MNRAGHRGGVVGVVVVLAILLVGCVQPSNTPTSYDDVTQSNFVEGCTEIYEAGSTTSTLGSGYSDSGCECVYNYFVNNVPFDETAANEQGKPVDPNFKAIDAALADDPTAFPADMQTALATQCRGFGSAGQPGSASTVASTTTTQPR